MGEATDLELTANVQIAEVIRPMAAWLPGKVRLEPDALVFMERGEAAAVRLSLADVERVWLATHVLGPDEVFVTARSGATWCIRVRSGRELVDALRAHGAAVEG